MKQGEFKLCLYVSCGREMEHDYFDYLNIIIIAIIIKMIMFMVLTVQGPPSAGVTSRCPGQRHRTDSRGLITKKS